jgi:hypothetical protein
MAPSSFQLYHAHITQRIRQKRLLRHNGSVVAKVLQQTGRAKMWQSHRRQRQDNNVARWTLKNGLSCAYEAHKITPQQ